MAVTTYSSLFNTRPFFSNPDTIILDDAHAAENYVVKMWSLEVPSDDSSLSSLYSALAGAFKPYITAQSFARLTGHWGDSFDATWVDKLPTEIAAVLAPQLTAVFDTHEKRER